MKQFTTIHETPHRLNFLPEFDAEAREGKASLIDSLVAAAMFHPAPEYTGRHRTADED